MEKEMEKEKNIMRMVIYYSKENIQMEKEMEMGKNIMLIMKQNLMENIKMEKDGKVKVLNMI